MDTKTPDFEIFSYEGADYKTLFTKKFLAHKKYEPEDSTRIIAQIPGTIVKIMVKEGQSVNPSKCLFIIDAMKMRNKVHASVTGIVREIHIHEGQIVSKNELLLELEEPGSGKKSKKKPKPVTKKRTAVKKKPFGKKKKISGK
ncbi:MAG: acetyl-CoA carboxylase biotin carboxyl carrier protein subunit [Bacteroidota bacterium]